MAPSKVYFGDHRALAIKRDILIGAVDQTEVISCADPHFEEFACMTKEQWIRQTEWIGACRAAVEKAPE